MEIYANLISLDENPKKKSTWIFPDNETYYKKGERGHYTSYSNKLSLIASDL